MIAKQYQKIIKKELNYIGTWLPGTLIALGDVGTLKQGKFQRITNLKSLKIVVKIIKDTTQNDFNFASDGVMVTMGNVEGKIATKGSGKASVRFERANSLLFKTKGVVHHIIEDQVALGVALKDLKNKGIWKQNWVVITEVAEVESATILFSTSAKNQIELEARITKGINEGLNIAYASLQWQLESGKNLGVEIIAQEKKTPLFKASKIKLATNKGAENFAELTLKDIEEDLE